MVIGSVALRHEPGVRQLVEAPLLEADREGAKRLGDLLRREGREHRRVDPAREEHADRDVRHEVRADRVAQSRTQLLDELRLLVVPHLIGGDRGRPRVPRQLGAPVLPGEHVAGLELADLTEDRQRAGNRVEGEECLERVEVDLATRESPQLGGERELAVRLAVVERLDPVAVAREHEPPTLGVPESDGEHPPEPVREALAVLLVEVDEHLRVSVRREPVPCALEVVAQLAVVVDLAVLDDGDPPVLVRDRLVAGGEVDDREAPRREPDGPVDVRAVGVRPALNERCAHRSEPAGVDGAARRTAIPQIPHMRH